MSQPTPPLRLVLMGTGPFAVPSFEALRDAGHSIALVVTKPPAAVKSRGAPRRRLSDRGPSSTGCRSSIPPASMIRRRSKR